MARKTIADVEDDAKEDLEDARERLEALIEKRPLEAVIASVLIGVLIGRFFL